MTAFRGLSSFLYGRRGFYLALLLLPPLLWLGVVYLGSLLALLLQSFYAIDEFRARIVPTLTLATSFYAIKMEAGVLGTAGGPKTNANGQVVDWSDKPIEGLYVAGNTMAQG